MSASSFGAGALLAVGASAFDDRSSTPVSKLATYAYAAIAEAGFLPDTLTQA